MGSGIDDEDVVLVLLNMRSGSIKVYFQPKHDHDRAFYQRKLDVIQSSLDGHDADKNIPFEDVVKDDVVS